MSQIIKKFIGDNQVGGAKIRVENNTSIRARNAADSGDVNIAKVNTSDQVELQSVTLASESVTVNAQVAVKSYVDSTSASAGAAAVAQAGFKMPVRAATTTALPAVTYANGTLGVGATLTANANGALTTIDGVTLVATNRLLVKNQAADLQNGIYVVTQVGDGSNPFILTRATDDDQAADLIRGSFVHVNEGSTNGNKDFYQSSASVVTVGTSSVTFATEASVSPTWNIESFTLSGGDITNQYVDLAQVALTNSIQFFVRGGGLMESGQDYTISYTGGAGGVTRLSFANDLATGGASALVASDVLQIQYQY